MTVAATKKKPRAIALGETALTFVANREEVQPLSEGFALSVGGLVVEGKPAFEKCAAAGKLLVVAERMVQFALGDYINYVEERFGERAAQIIDFSDGWSEETCAKYAWLSKRVHPERRRMDRLGVRHHMLVAPLAPSLQNKWLARAAADNEEKPWTVQRLAAAMKDVEELPETFWLLVAAKSEEDQAVLQEELSSKGRSCKAVVRRVRAPKVEKAAKES